MAFTTALAVLGASALGAGASIVSGNKATKAATKSADKAADVQQYMYDTARADDAPWRAAGAGALGKLTEMFGISSPGQPATGGVGAAMTGETGGDKTYGGFTTSPGYQWRIDQATKAIERAASSRGVLGSRKSLESLNRSVQGEASGEYNNYVGNLMRIAGFGENANSRSASAGATAANGMASSYLQGGQAAAAGAINTGNAINSGVQNLTSAYLYGKGAGWFGASPSGGGVINNFGNA